MRRPPNGEEQGQRRQDDAGNRGSEFDKQIDSVVGRIEAARLDFRDLVLKLSDRKVSRVDIRLNRLADPHGGRSGDPGKLSGLAPLDPDRVAQQPDAAADVAGRDRILPSQGQPVVAQIEDCEVSGRAILGVEVIGLEEASAVPEPIQAAQGVPQIQCSKSISASLLLG